MRAPLDTSTSDIVIAFLICVGILAAIYILWDVVATPRCTDCGQRPKPRTGADLDAMEAHPGRCQDCARRRTATLGLVAVDPCAVLSCTKTWNGTEWICGRCGRPLTIERTSAS